MSGSDTPQRSSMRPRIRVVRRGDVISAGYLNSLKSGIEHLADEFQELAEDFGPTGTAAGQRVLEGTESEATIITTTRPLVDGAGAQIGTVDVEAATRIVFDMSDGSVLALNIKSPDDR